MITWGFIGCGNLAQSLILGALDQKLISSSQILITNRTTEKSFDFSRKSGVEVARNNGELIQRADVIFVGTKPLEILPVLEEISKYGLESKVIVSLATGVGAEILNDYCGNARSIFRVMANTPATIQRGVFGIYGVKSSPQDRENIFAFFSKLGLVVPLKNDKEVNVITAGSASGVGFVFSFMEEFERWFVSKGLTSKAARDIAVATFLGAAALAKKSENLKLAQLREAVTSKKGTTLEGLNAFKKRKVAPGLKSGLEAAFKRSQEIAKSLLRSLK